MTREQVKKQALGRLKLSLRPALLEKASLIADSILDPLMKRDETVDEGKSTAEKYDPATFSSQTVEVQLHAPRPVKPYNYGARDVLALERSVRRRMGL